MGLKTQPMRIRIFSEGAEVHVEAQGKPLLGGHWTQIEAVARLMLKHARSAEEYDNAEQIASNQALLLRAGIPLATATRRDVGKEALKMAQHDKQLRREVPKPSTLIETKPVVYRPRIRQSPPDLEAMTPQQRAIYLARLNPNLRVETKQ